MKTLIALITLMTVFFSFLALLGGIVSGIWLAILSEWGSLGLGILFFSILMFALSIVLLPYALLAAPGAYFADKGKTFGAFFFGALSNLYIIAVITVWCCGVFYVFISDATNFMAINSSSSLIPRLIWSYGVAIGPWAYMTSKERDSVASVLSTFFAALAYVAIIFMGIFGPVNLFQALKMFAVSMLGGFIIQMTLACQARKEIFYDSGQ